MILLLMLFAVIWLYGMIVSAKRYSEGTVFALHLFGVQESVMLKGLLAVGVVMGHIQIFCMKPHDYPLVNQLAVFAQVGVFFFISGYGLVASYQSKPQTYLNGFLRHRLTKIVLPLGMATVLYLVERKYLLGTSGGGNVGYSVAVLMVLLRHIVVLFGLLHFAEDLRKFESYNLCNAFADCGLLHCHGALSEVGRLVV